MSGSVKSRPEHGKRRYSCAQLNIRRAPRVPLIRLPNHAEILQKERETANLARIRSDDGREQYTAASNDIALLSVYRIRIALGGAKGGMGFFNVESSQATDKHTQQTEGRSGEDG